MCHKPPQTPMSSDGPSCNLQRSPHQDRQASASFTILLPEKFQHLWYRRNAPFPHPNCRLVVHHQQSRVFKLRKTQIGLASVEVRRSLPFHIHPSDFDSLCRAPRALWCLISLSSTSVQPLAIATSSLQRAVRQLDQTGTYPIKITYLP